MTTNNADKIFKFLQKCNRRAYCADVHSFTIKITNGSAYVECWGGNEVYIETNTCTASGEEKRSQWCGTTVAAANRLEKLGAIYETIDM